MIRPVFISDIDQVVNLETKIMLKMIFNYIKPGKLFLDFLAIK